MTLEDDFGPAGTVAGKKKAIFIDGRNLGGMRRALGIGQYDLAALYKLLTEKVGGGTRDLGQAAIHDRPRRLPGGW